MNKDISLSYGDIFTIVAEKNPAIHNRKYFIHHISTSNITAIDLISNAKQEFKLEEETGYFQDESIQKLIIHHHDNRGYALKNDLVPGKWIDILFELNVPFYITGQITGLEGDRIEITRYPISDLSEVFYIDFEYKGIPSHLPIKITFREKPTTTNQSNTNDSKEETDDVDNDKEDDDEEEEEEEPDSDPRLELDAAYREGQDELIFGDAPLNIVEHIEIDEKKRLYSLEAQINDLINSLLANIKNKDRTKKVMDNIAILIDKYKLLHKTHTGKNDEDKLVVVRNPKKPLVDKLKQMDGSVFWIKPVTVCRRQLIGDEKELAHASDATQIQHIIPYLGHMKRTQHLYEKNRLSFQEASNQIQQQLISFETSPYSQWIWNRIPLLSSDIPVKSDIDAIIDNLGEYSSSVYGTHVGQTKDLYRKIFAKKFVGQRYVANDLGKMHLKSFLTLPLPCQEYSRIYRPMTNIMESSHLSQDYMMMFRVINAYQSAIKEMNLNDADDLANPTIGINAANYNLEKQQESAITTIDEALHKMIPETFHLLHSFPFIEDQIRFGKIKGYSFVDFANVLEPFFITYDNIQYRGTYKRIRYLINQAMEQYKIKLRHYKDAYTARLVAMKPLQTATPKSALITDILDGKEDAVYKMKHLLTSSEQLKSMLDRDGAEMAMVMTKIKSDHLTVDPKFVEAVVPKDSEEESIKIDCARRVLAKHYSSINELEDDNDKEIFHDEDLDETPYNLLQTNKELAKAKEAQDADKIASILIKKHACPQEHAEPIANALILGQRQVQEGEFAFVVKPINKYYRRQNNTWVLDASVSETYFIGSNKLFCAMNDKCTTNPKLNVCEPIGAVKNIYLEEFRKRLEEEDQKRQQWNQERMNTLLDKFEKKRMLHELQQHKYNNMAVELARSVKLDETSNVSPAQKFLSVILDIKSEPEKQKYICDFVNTFTRTPRIEFLQLENKLNFTKEEQEEHDAIVKESPHWLYCKETNTPLLPMFVYECAKAFMQGGMENYIRKQDEYISQSDSSEDNAFYVEKHTGWAIRKRGDVDEQLWDDSGHIIATGDVLEKDDQETDEEKRPEYLKHKMSQVILQNLCDYFGINIDNVKEFVLRVSYEMIQNIETEQVYNNYMRAKFKGQQTFPPYINHYYKHVIIAVASTLFIRIQTALTKIRRNSHKVCQGVHPTFQGYPLGNLDEQEGVKYMSCVLNSLKTKEGYWASMEKATTIAALMLVKLKQLANTEEVKQMYRLKRNVMKKVSDVLADLAPTVKKWDNFSPPLQEFHISKKVANISTELKREVERMISKGHKDQEQHLGLYKAKVAACGLAMIELINTTIKDKAGILKGADNIPAVQNSCCNETQTTNAFAYFAHEKPEIKTFLTIVKQVEAELNRVKDLETAPLFFDKTNTKKRTTSAKPDILEETMYETIIHHLKLDHPEIPIPSMFDGIHGIPKEKPQEFSKRTDSKEKYEILKSTIKVDKAMYEDVLRTVNQTNMIQDTNPKISWVDDGTGNMITETLEKDSQLWRWKRFIKTQTDQFPYDNNTNDASINQTRIYTTILHYFDSFFEQNTGNFDVLTNLKLYLLDTNAKLTATIQKLVLEYDPSLDAQSAAKVFQTIDTVGKLEKWDIWAFGNKQPCFQFLREAISNIGKLYPNMIKNRVRFQQMGDRWKFSAGHYKDMQDLVDKSYYKILKAFSKEDAAVVTVLDAFDTTNNPEFLYGKSWVHTATNFMEQYPNTPPFHDLKTTIYNTLWLLTIFICISPEPSHAQEFVFDQDEITARNAVNQKRVQMVASFLEIEQHKKHMIDKSSLSFTKETKVSKEMEKKRFTDVFKNLNKDGQRLMSQMKNLGLGMWYEGKQGLVNYDPNAYDRERKAAAKDMANFVTAGDVLNAVVDDDSGGQEGDVDADSDEEEDGYDDDNDDDYDDDE
jgi:hypothetical protein